MEKNREAVDEIINQYLVAKHGEKKDQYDSIKEKLLVAAQEYINKFDKQNANEKDLETLNKLKVNIPANFFDSNLDLLDRITGKISEIKRKSGGKKTKKRKKYKQKNKSKKKN